MRRFFAMLCVLVAVGHITSRVARAELLGITFTDELITIDPTTGAGTSVGSLSSSMLALGLGTRAGRLYTYDQTAHLIRELDPGTAATVATIDVGIIEGGEGGLAFRSDGIGFLAEATHAAGQLFSFDITIPGSMPPVALSPSMDGLAFDGRDVLYGISQGSTDGGTKLYTIDPISGVTTLVGDLGVGISATLGGLDFAPDGRFFAAISAGAESFLYTVDSATGAATLVGEIGFSGVSGLAFLEPVSEPATLPLIALGATGLLLLRRCFRARQPAATVVQCGCVALVAGVFNLITVPEACADLLVTSQFTDEVLRYDETTGDFIGVFASGSGLADPRDLAFGPDDNLYVVSRSSHEVLRFDGVTGAFIDTFAEGGLAGPVNLVFGPDAHLYVANVNTLAEPLNNVVRFHGMTGEFLGVFVASGSGGLNNPRGLAFGPDGNLYVSSLETDEIKRYDGATGASIDTFAAGGGLHGPEGLVFGPDGNLYVASFVTDNILQYDGATGSFLGVFASGGGLDQPSGMVFGPDGDLYVTSSATDNVLRYDGATGAFMDVFAAGGGLSHPIGLTFTPRRAAVPEPTSLTLCGLGVLSILGCCRRRKQSEATRHISGD